MKTTTSQRIQKKKTASWTLISMSITILVVFAFTGSWEFAGTIGLIERIIKIFAYYPHERFWHKRYKRAKKDKE